MHPHWFSLSLAHHIMSVQTTYELIIHLTSVGIQADSMDDHQFHHGIKTVRWPASEPQIPGTESKPSLPCLTFALESEFSEWFSEGPSLWCKRQIWLAGRSSRTQPPGNNNVIISTNPFKLQQSNYLSLFAWVDVS